MTLLAIVSTVLSPLAAPLTSPLTSMAHGALLIDAPDVSGVSGQTSSTSAPTQTSDPSRTPTIALLQATSDHSDDAATLIVGVILAPSGRTQAPLLIMTPRVRNLDEAMSAVLLQPFVLYPPQRNAKGTILVEPTSWIYADGVLSSDGSSVIPPDTGFTIYIAGIPDTTGPAGGMPSGIALSGMSIRGIGASPTSLIAADAKITSRRR